MITFRKCSGLVIKEMAERSVYSKQLLFAQVNAEHFVKFLNYAHRQTLTKNICNILFKCVLNVDGLNLFNTWIRRK